MRHALSHWVIPGLLLLVASEVGAQPIRIGQSFSPHPLVTPEITAKNGEQYLSKRGFEKCGRDPDYVTDEPVLTFTLTEEIPELSVRLEDRDGEARASGGVIVAPDGSYFCDDKRGEVFSRTGPRARTNCTCTDTRPGSPPSCASKCRRVRSERLGRRWPAWAR